MAQELSQEALLDFLCQAGGRVTNAALLSHFKSFLRDPAAPPSQHQRRRELFKGYVNSVAAVRQDPDGTKYVVLKRRYRDLLGEEGLQRPGAPPAAAAASSPRGARRAEPQARPRRRDQEPEEEPAGAAARAADAGCNGLPASGAREAAPEGGGRGDSAGPIPPAPGAGDQAGVPCAGAEARGQCCWECQQSCPRGLPNDLPLGTFEDPASTGEQPVPALAAPGDHQAPEPQLEGVPAGTPEPAPAACPSLPATVEAAGSQVDLPTLPPRPSPPGDPPDTLHYLTLQQQQRREQRTQEWVTRYPQIQTRDEGPTRIWTVVPDDFLQLPLEPSFLVAETDLAPPLPSLFPGVHEEPPESWAGNLPVFRSIRCQLSLQDLDDFVDQESHGSEESSSGPKESPGGSEDGLQAAPRTPDGGKIRSPVGGISVSPEKGSPSKSPPGGRTSGQGHPTQQVPAAPNGLANHPQEALPWPAPKLRRSLRRTSRTGRAKLSSSDEELLEEDFLKRSRRPPRSSFRRPSRAGAMPSPRVDAALAPKASDRKALVLAQGGPHSSWAPSQEGPAALSIPRAEHKSSQVPLDAREHEWIVTLATGSWVQALPLFGEDPQLALHRDFLTGYTALHWLAKHGNLGALQDLVSGAKKAGIALDVNAKSGCGYTPLHLAAIHGHQGVIKLLVQRLSSRVNIRDSSGKKPWQYLTSNTSGEIWQLLGAPRGKPIFPVYPLVQSSSPTRKAKNKEVSRSVTRKTSLAALLKSQHNKWKLVSQYEKFSIPRELEEYSD
ncbi:ankyrin repeat domain-containing protein SOWAHB [Tenrec ecaudatus]|uniref:ankyrin repeat domain-containing protein SOWAHB n=1 Tax=Tenrec ecaudatus TaxID=94439 RepID=UPI003F5980A4